MKVKKSVLQLKAVKINELHIDWNLQKEALKNVNPEEYTVDIDFNIFGVKESEDAFIIELVVKINHSRKKNFPFRATLMLSSVFTFTEPVEESKKPRYLLYNGLSILYSFIRGYLFAKLDLLLPNHRIIPTVDLLELIQKKMKAKLRK